MNHRKKPCPDSPNGQHEFTPDLEYDQTGETINCEHCGEPKPRRPRRKKKPVRIKIS